MNDRIDPDDRRGTVGVGPDGDYQIRFQRRLAHPPARVWDSLVSPDEQAHWTPGARFEARVGAPVMFDFGDEGRAEGEVLVADPPRTLEHSWLWPGEPPSTVRWQLEPDGDGTLLVLLHRPLRQEPAVDYCAGWHAMLDALGTQLDGGDPNVSLSESAYAALYEQYTATAPPR